jgi:Fe2+ transport system protein B
MKIDKQTKQKLMELWKTKKIGLEGNIIKIIDAEGDEEFSQYLKEVLEKDTTSRRKRLDITRQVQTQNNELTKWKEENEKIQSELVESLKQTEISMHESERLRDDAERAMLEAETAKEEALLAKEEAEIAKEEAENAKIAAENDLDLIQKKTQFELIGTIIKVALWVILGVGIVTTVVYLIAMFSGVDTAVIGSTWSNIVGILLTNSFSIVGTIMGVKYASDKPEKSDK